MLLKWIWLPLLKRLAFFQKILYKIDWKIASEDLHTFIKTDSITGYFFKLPLCFQIIFKRHSFGPNYPRVLNFLCIFFHTSRISAFVLFIKEIIDVQLQYYALYSSHFGWFFSSFMKILFMSLKLQLLGIQALIQLNIYFLHGQLKYYLVWKPLVLTSCSRLFQQRDQNLQKTKTEIVQSRHNNIAQKSQKN